MSILQSNPAFKPELFGGNGSWAQSMARANVMTVSGTVNRAFILTTLCLAGAVAGYGLTSKYAIAPLPIMVGTFVLGLVLSLVMMFKPQTSPFIAPPFAMLEGLFVGCVSYWYATSMAGTKVGGATGDGIILNAGLLTIVTLLGMLGLYKFGVIRATGKFKAVMAAVGVGIALYCVVSLGLSLFGVFPSFLNQGPIAIAICVGILIFASLCLILDFDFIEQGAASGAPKYMEWYAGFALLMTLVWIYLQFLRLLSLLSRRD